MTCPQPDGNRKPLFRPYKKIIQLLIAHTLLLLHFAIVSKCGFAAEPNPVNVDVTAIVKPRHIQFTEKAILALSMSGNTFIEHIDTPIFNFLPTFIAVPLRSSSTPRLEQDKIAVSMAWYYELIPQEIGDFSLSDIRFSYQGTSYFANPGSIRVSGVNTYIDASTGGTHTVAAKVTSQTVYLNQEVTYTFRYLYTTILPTREEPIPILPPFPDCLVEELPSLGNQTEQIGRQRFWVQTHQRRLYPQKTGTIVIEPASIRLLLKHGSKTLKTESLRLKVQSLPQIGKPEGFTGAVGEYQLTAHVDRGVVEAGSAFSLTLHIAGQGNMRTVIPPKLPPIPGVVINGPTRAEAAIPQNHVYVYALIPSRVGTFKIPTIKYPYWHPQRRAYQITQTAPIPLTVLPKPNTDVSSDDTEWNPWLFLLALPIFIGVAIGGYLWYRVKFKPEESGNAECPPDVQVVAAIRALESKTTQNASEFGNTLAQTVYQYLELEIRLTQRNTTGIRQAGAQAGLRAPILDELIEILTQCDYYRFSPAPISAEVRQALISRVEAVIYDIARIQKS